MYKPIPHYLSAAALLLLSFGCDKSRDPDYRRGVRGADETRRVETVEIREWLSSNAILPDDRLKGNIDLDEERYFSGGWRPAVRAGSAPRARPMGPRAGSLDFALARVADLTISFTLAGPTDATLPLQDVSLLCNGRLLGAATLNSDFNTYTIPVSSGHLRVGPNRLELIPAYWSTENGESTSLFLSQLAISADTASASPSPSSATPSHPFLQPPNSVFTFYTTADAVSLRVEAELEAAEGSAAPDQWGEVAIVLTTQTGESRTLLQETINSPTLSSSIELEVNPGEFAAISVAYTAPANENGAATPSIRWNRLDLGRSRTIRTATASPPPSSPNVLIVLFDTLRGDHIESADTRNVRTPNLFRLAQQGALFTAAQSNTSWTRSSVATLLTSTYETVHGTTMPEDRFTEDLPSVSELLRAKGYNTTSVCFNMHIDSRYGFQRGFDRFYELWSDRTTRVRETATPEKWAEHIWEQSLSETVSDGGKPFFIYLHELDPHAPYEANPPYDELYASGYPGRPETADKQALIRAGKMELNDADHAYLNEKYRGEITYMDAVLGRILQLLDDTGRAEDTMVVFLSDHGEEFGEHGGIGHGTTLYEESLRVPMLWKFEGVIDEGIRIDSPVSLIDVAPTILEALGIEAPPSMQGTSLLAALRGKSDDTAVKPVFAHLHSGRSSKNKRSVRVKNWKLVDSRNGARRTLELFNLTDDPEERFNVWTKEQIVGGALAQLLAQQQNLDEERAASPPSTIPIQSLDDQAKEELKALGYLE